MNKIDFLILFDVTDANPNGDPDAGNLPRMDAESGHSLITDVCLKRKVRNFIQLTKDGEPGYEIYVKEKAILNNQQNRAYEALEISQKDAKQADYDKAKSWMCQTFFDIRTFGAVMTTGVNCGQVRGPIQISFARSIDPVSTSEFAVTRCAVTTEAESIKQKGDNRTMGRKFTLPYALYKTQGCLNPFLAKQTGFSENDWKVFQDALVHLFDFDASAARPSGSMAIRKIVLFKHDSELGNAPAHKLFDAVSVVKHENVEFPRSIQDYDITIHHDLIPDGVTVEEIDC